MLYNPLPLIMLIVGIYLLARIGFFYFLHPFRAFSEPVRSLGDRRNLAAFTLALAGTLGVGNVLGVALGIIVGGPGSVFWLLISSVPAGVLKYAEVTLAEDRREREHGGMFYCIRGDFGRLGMPLSTVYSVACLLLSFVMGAALQTRTVADGADELLGISPLLVGIISAIIVFISVFKGGKIISKITAIVIPMTTIIYIFIASGAIITGFDRIVEVIELIIKDAFSPMSGVGGALGLLTSSCMREGFARGMLSNEAGSGTSGMAHASGTPMKPAARGLLGVLEVFFDTTLLCMLTALAILVSVPDPSLYDGGMDLIIAAISASLGPLAPWGVLLCVLGFAYSTVICWYYYGRECVAQLLGERGGAAFTVLFVGFVLLGATFSEWALVAFADALLLILTLLTLPVLIKNSDRIKALSESLMATRVK